MDYTLALSSDGAAGPLTHEAAGNSLAAADLMEDDYNRTTLLRDIDLAVANPVNDTVTIMLGNRTTDSRGRLAYRNLLDSGAFSPHDIGHSPTDIAIYNIDGDTARDLMGDAGYDWHQGSTGVDPYYEVYNDLVTTNADGTMTIAINAGGIPAASMRKTSSASSPHSSRSLPNFYTASLGLGYTMANNAFGGPLQDATGVVVGDFNADGVTDFAVAEQYDVAVLNQAYPFHSSDPLDLNMYADEWPDTDLSFGFAGRYSVIPDLGQRDVTYYATAIDNLYGYPNNLQYEGYSDPAMLTLMLNQRPLIWSVTANAETLGTGDPVTLTANGVQDLDGYVSEVRFYLYRGSGNLDTTQDTLVGTDRNGNDGWTYTGTLADADAIYYAVAVDNNDALGSAVATHVNVDPVIGSLSADATVQQGDVFYLAATDVLSGDHATTSQIKKVEFFLDSNYDGVFEPGVDRSWAAARSSTPATRGSWSTGRD